MKKCDIFRDLILTAYTDGETDKLSAKMMQDHLSVCKQCSAFLKEVQKNTVLPFQQSQRQPVPEELWDAIRQGIEQEAQAKSPFEAVIEQLKGLVRFPRLVPVFASFILMFLAGAVTFNSMQLQQARDKEQGEYLLALLSPNGSSAQGDSNEPGTPIEHYFL